MIRNSILDRWDQLRRDRRGAAILSPGGEILRTWQEIEDEARGLEKRVSTGAGTVTVQTGNSPAVPAILLACWRSGRPVALLDTELLGDARARLESSMGATLRISGMEGGEIDASGTRSVGSVVESDTGFPACERVQSQAGKPVSLSGVSKNIDVRDGQRVCFYKITAGQNGGLRTIGFAGDQLLADCDQVAETMGIGPEDINYGIVSFAHSYGFSSLLTPLLCRGVRLVVGDDGLPWAMESGLRLSGASVLPLVPAMFRALMCIEELPSSLRLCVSAGTSLDPALAEGFHLRFGRKIHSFYGTSECGGICYDASEEIFAEPGFVGRPIAGVEVEIVSPEATGGSLIQVRSSAMATGEGSNDGNFNPRDLMVRCAGGLRIVGSVSNIINVAGKKVHPADIEAELKTFPGVLDAVVFGAADRQRGEEVCALIVSHRPADPAAVRRHCANRLPSWQVPRRVRVVAALPADADTRENRRKIAARIFAGPT